jgi:phage shock protein E
VCVEMGNDGGRPRTAAHAGGGGGRRGGGLRAARALVVGTAMGCAAWVLQGCDRGTGAPARPPGETADLAGDDAAPSVGAPAVPGAGDASPSTAVPRPTEAPAESERAPTAEPIVPAPAADGDVLLIEVTEVHEKLGRSAPLLVIDARGRADYELEHVPDAVNVPLPKIAAAGQLPGVPRDYEIAVYCSAETCPLSREAVRALMSFGYTNVKDMRAGLVGWKQAGFRTARGKESG